MSARPTVLVVDDSASFRAAATALLEAGGLSVVGVAATAATALSMVDSARPEVVLIDVQLGAPEDGFDLAERLAARCDAALVMVSSREPSSYGPRLATAPVRGFITKRGLTAAALSALIGSPG